jgi:AraC family transcriptional regulator of adaptative response/methylated-DNA-[protein]-cysteine methyltransferase
MIMQSKDYSRMEAAIRYLESNFDRQPSLEDVSTAMGLSRYHFQRVFRRWAGISPKKFLEYITVENAKALLEDSRPVLDVAFSTGLSSTSRLYDMFVNIEAMTPGEYKQKGEGLEIACGVHSSPFGECLVAATGRGICALEFCEPAGGEKAINGLQKKWPGARISVNLRKTRAYADTIFPLHRGNAPAPVNAFLMGTLFQVKVWEALLKIPPGSVASYGDIARAIDAPSHSRAVGQAVGRNPIAYLIPCHRVIQGLGAFGHYRWGSARKRAMLAWERARLIPE